MIKYEIFTTGNQEKVQEFESWYQYKQGERIFLEMKGQLFSMTISTITHNHTNGTPVTRLDCNPSRYVTKK